MHTMRDFRRDEMPHSKNGSNGEPLYTGEPLMTDAAYAAQHEERILELRRQVGIELEYLASNRKAVREWLEWRDAVIHKRICANCEREFEQPTSGAAVTCSPKCRSEWQSKKQKGVVRRKAKKTQVVKRRTS